MTLSAESLQILEDLNPWWAQPALVRPELAVLRTDVKLDQQPQIRGPCALRTARSDPVAVWPGARKIGGLLTNAVQDRRRGFQQPP